MPTAQPRPVGAPPGSWPDELRRVEKKYVGEVGLERNKLGRFWSIRNINWYGIG